MEKLVEGLLSGKSDTVTVPIEMKVPRALYQTYLALSQQTGVPVQQALENLANQGIQKALNDSLKINMDQNGMADLMKQNGFDLTPLTEGLGKLSSLTGEIQKLQKVFELHESGTPPKDQ